MGCAPTEEGRPGYLFAGAAPASAVGQRRSGNSTVGLPPHAKVVMSRRRCRLGTIHDLRPTFVTHILDRKALPHVVEACVNHVSATRRVWLAFTIARTMLDEKRAARDAWGRHILAVLR